MPSMGDGSDDSSLELGSLDLAKRSASDLPADNSRGWGTLRLPYSIAPSEVAQGVKGCQRKHLFNSVHLGVRCRSAQVHYRYRYFPGFAGHPRSLTCCKYFARRKCSPFNANNVSYAMGVVMNPIHPLHNPLSRRKYRKQFGCECPTNEVEVVRDVSTRLPDTLQFPGNCAMRCTLLVRIAINVVLAIPRRVWPVWRIVTDLPKACRKPAPPTSKAAPVYWASHGDMYLRGLHPTLVLSATKEDESRC